MHHQTNEQRFKTKFENMQKFTNPRQRQLQLWQSGLKNRSASTVLFTSPRHSVEMLTVQGCTKTWVLDYSFLARRLRWACNFEASKKLYWAPDQLLLQFSWRNAQTAGAGSISGRGTDKNVLNSPFFDYIGDSKHRRRRQFFWGWLDTTHRLWQFLWISECPPTIHSPIDKCKNLGDYLRVKRSLHVAPESLAVKLSEVIADLVYIATPASQKKMRWLICGFPTKSCTQNRAPSTLSSATIARSRLRTNFSPEVTAPRKMRVISWNTCNKDTPVTAPSLEKH